MLFHVDLQRRLYANLNDPLVGMCNTYAGCVHKDCDTEVRIFTSGGLGSITIERTLGELKSATDPKWVAQLE
jgi:hypothetical protein